MENEMKEKNPKDKKPGKVSGLSSSMPDRPGRKPLGQGAETSDLKSFIALETKDPTVKILKDIRNGGTSLRTIFFRPDPVLGKMVLDVSGNSAFLNALFALFSVVESELENGFDVKQTGSRVLQASDIAPDSADWFNAIAEMCGDVPVHEMLQRELALSLASYKSANPSGNSAMELEKFWELHAGPL